MCGSMVDIQPTAAEIRRGKKRRRRRKKKKKKKEITGQKYNGLPYYIGQTIMKREIINLPQVNKNNQNIT